MWDFQKFPGAIPRTPIVFVYYIGAISKGGRVYGLTIVWLYQRFLYGVPVIRTQMDAVI